MLEGRGAAGDGLAERRGLVLLRDRQLQVLPPERAEEDRLEKEGICAAQPFQPKECEQLGWRLLIFA